MERIVPDFLRLRIEGIVFVENFIEDFAVDHLRKKSKHATVSIEDMVVVGGDDPSKVAEGNLQIEELATATRRLTAAQREVISLRFACELSVAECARAMEKSEGAVKALQHSAIAALRRVLAVGTAT